MPTVFDIEADGLLDEATKIHCLSYHNGKELRTVFDYGEMAEVLLNTKVLIGHNIVRYDIPLLERILGIKIDAQLIDTLPLSWYLNVDYSIHGLEFFGKKFGVPKPEIKDWVGLSREDYKRRCEEDVKINRLLWVDLRKHLMELYDTHSEADKLIQYLTFKMDCAREQERSGWKLDLPKVKKHIVELTLEQEEKVKTLSLLMPKVEKVSRKMRPKKPYKANGDLSVQGVNWRDLCEKNGYSIDYPGPIEVVVGYEEPNPNSPEQVKSWLFGLGWEPCTYKYDRKDDGTEKQIPQVRKEGTLTPSVIALGGDVEALEGLSVIQHRLSILKSFRDYHVDGWLKAEIAGLTNTLRFKHKKPLANLPGVDKPWGKEVRGCLIAPEGYILCGSDMVSLEDTTKRHYMYPYDPDYVRDMSVDGFDPHLDLAKHANFTTQEDIDKYTKGENPGLKVLRKQFKVANYSCIYGVRPNRLSRELRISKELASSLIDAYWKRNWSISKLSKDLTVKKVRGKMWLFNPVSKFWYNLRYDKDRFSTLNQGTGVFCFDSWIGIFRKRRKQLTAQFHDEIVACLKKEFKERYRKLLKDSIGELNNTLKLNIELDVDVQFGKTYAEIH